MAEVKWIKIATDIFDDEKILLIESLPDSYAIITAWFKLLCLAGKQNNDGVFLMNDKIAYTDKMLATIFRMKESTVKLALDTFEQFEMIQKIDGAITIPKWNKHQTLDAYEKKKARDRRYQEERRARQRALIKKSSDKSFEESSDVAVSEEERDIDNNICSPEPDSLRRTVPQSEEVPSAVMPCFPQYLPQRSLHRYHVSLSEPHWTIQKSHLFRPVTGSERSDRHFRNIHPLSRLSAARSSLPVRYFRMLP